MRYVTGPIYFFQKAFSNYIIAEKKTHWYGTLERSAGTNEVDGPP